MKSFTNSEKDVLRNESVQKTVVKIHEKYLWNRWLFKLQLIQLFWKLTLLQVFLKKSDHSSNWINLWAPIWEDKFSRIHKILTFCKNLFLWIGCFDKFLQFFQICKQFMNYATRKKDFTGKKRFFVQLNDFLQATKCSQDNEMLFPQICCYFLLLPNQIDSSS